MKLHLSALGELIGRYGRAFTLSWKHRHELEPPRRPREESEFLPAVLALQDTPSHPLPHLAMWAIMSLIVLAITWATLGKIDIVAVAVGQVVPSGNTKIVQAPDDARVTDIRVDDGQAVKAGDVLLVLDGESSQADVTRLTQALAAAKLQAAQGQALTQSIDQHAPAGVQAITNLDQSIAQEAQDRVNRQWQEYRSQYNQLDAQINQLEQQQNSIRAQLGAISQSLPILKQQEQDYQNMMSQDYLPRHTLLDKQRQRVETEGNQATLQGRLRELEASMSTIKRQQETLKAQVKRTAADQIQQGLQQSAQIEQELIKAQRQNRLMTITAPVDGTVQQLAIHTIGAVVTPAQALLAIVPNNSPIEVDATIENKDIGFVHAGQIAAVKVDTFKFTKYGTLPAEVTSISSDAIQDEKRGPIYNARVTLKKDTLNIDGRDVRLSPGMSVSVEIKTGQRPIIEYFLTPLLQHSQESLKER